MSHPFSQLVRSAYVFAIILALSISQPTPPVPTPVATSGPCNTASADVVRTRRVGFLAKFRARRAGR